MLLTHINNWYNPITKESHLYRTYSDDNTSVVKELLPNNQEVIIDLSDPIAYANKLIELAKNGWMNEIIM